MLPTSNRNSVQHTLIDAPVKWPRSANIASAPVIMKAQMLAIFIDEIRKSSMLNFDILFEVSPVIHNSIPPSESQPSFPVIWKNLMI